MHLNGMALIMWHTPPSHSLSAEPEASHYTQAPPTEQQLLLKLLESMPSAEHERFLGEKLHLLVQVHILSIYLSTHLSIYLCIYLSTYLPIYLSPYLLEVGG